MKTTRSSGPGNPAGKKKQPRSVPQLLVWSVAEALALGTVLGSTLRSPLARFRAGARASKRGRFLAEVRVERVTLLNRIRERGLGRAVANWASLAPSRLKRARNYADRGWVRQQLEPERREVDIEGSFEFLRALGQETGSARVRDRDTAVRLVRALYVARLFPQAVQAFEDHLINVARTVPQTLGLETLRAYALSLVRLGRGPQADAFLSELVASFPRDPMLKCCSAIVRLPVDPGSARRLFAEALDLGEKTQLTLNFLVWLMLQEGQPTSEIRARLRGSFRSDDRRAETREDAALLEALLSAAEGEPAAQLAHINRCLSFQGVARLALRDQAGALSPWNLKRSDRDPGAGGPLVSILVTTYNSAEFIAGSLRSLTEQSYRDLEIIVCDDASGDATTVIVQSLAEADPRIRLLRNAVNVGTYASKNRAFLASRGAFATCHDSDDWAHPEKIERQVESVVLRPNRVGSRSFWIRVDNACRPILTNWGAFIHANPASLLLRREVFERVGLFDSVRVAADSEFASRVRLVFGAESIGTVRACLSLGLDRADSLTRSRAFGFSADQRSEIREAYWAAWARWHIEADPADLHMDYLPGERRFDVPAEIAVSERDIRANLAAR